MYPSCSADILLREALTNLASTPHSEAALSPRLCVLELPSLSTFLRECKMRLRPPPPLLPSLHSEIYIWDGPSYPRPLTHSLCFTKCFCWPYKPPASFGKYAQYLLQPHASPSWQTFPFDHRRGKASGEKVYFKNDLRQGLLTYWS